jgi:hypothetical protein
MGPRGDVPFDRLASTLAAMDLLPTLVVDSFLHYVTELSHLARLNFWELPAWVSSVF